MKFLSICLFFLLCLPVLLPAQPQDTVHFQWPNPPFNTSHYLNATFCEYRNTLSANHFHSGVDIGETGSIYSCLHGIVHSLSTTDGDNNFVRVRTQVGDKWKHISYVHIQPSPGLSPGDSVVAAVTVLGTVIAGQGHVHLTERELVSDRIASGVEINAVRAGGGLDPFIDTYSPVIDQTQILFREVTGNVFLPSGSLYGKIEFIVKVNERNAPGGVGTTQTNNGTYQLGYRILSDSLTVAYEPPDAGVRFRFDRKPYDDYADNVFFPVYSNTGAHYYRLTSGLGANDLYFSRSAGLGFVDVSAFDEGSYYLQIFTLDTRQNADTVLYSIFITHDDLIPPGPPTLSYVTVKGADTLTVAWQAGSEPDVKGYRVRFFDGTSWNVAASESTLTSAVLSVSFPSPPPFLRPTDSLNRIPIAVTAVDTATPPNESARGDVYAAGYPWFSDAPGQSKDFRAQRPILLVDGFDRYGGSGSWTSLTHEFIRFLADAIPSLLPVSSCSNEAVASGSVDLNSYRSVFWLLGDESTEGRTLTSVEQSKVEAYLEAGGQLFISGSEIGWDLGRPHSKSEPGDLAFYQNYLKAQLMYDGDAGMTAAQGISGTLFEGLTVTIGQTYPEDYPDDIQPINGASAALIYNAKRQDGSWRLAGLSFAGTFGSGMVPGKLVYITFPFETIGSPVYRKSFIERVATFFDIPTGVVKTDSPIPASFMLSQNYPNPFNPSTRLTLQVPSRGFVTLRIFDLLGRQIAQVLEGEYEAGTYAVDWDAALFPSGTYFAVADFAESRQIRKLLLLR